MQQGAAGAESRAAGERAADEAASGRAAPSAPSAPSAQSAQAAQAAQVGQAGQTARRALRSGASAGRTQKADRSAAQDLEDVAATDGEVVAAPSGGARGIERIAGNSTRLRQLRFAKVLAETCNVSLAAAAAGRTLATVHRWRSVDAAFAAAWDEALNVGYDRLENALLVYALTKIDGVAGAAAGASLSNGDLQLAVGMLQRHRASGGGRRAEALPIKMPTEAETDAALKRALDGLARRGKPS